MIEVLLTSSVRALILALAVALAAALLRVKRPETRHLLGLAVLLGMLALPLLELAAPRLAVPLPTFAEAAPQAGPAGVWDALLAPAAPTTGADAPAPTEAPRSAVEPAATTASDGGGWGGRLAGLYLAGVLLFAARLARGISLARRLAAEATPTDDRRWHAYAREIAGRPVRLATHPRVRMPLAMGIFHPAVLLPPAWSRWDDDTRRLVVAHEALHLRRRDPLARLLLAAARCLYWFHPVPWLLTRLLPHWAEQACDAGVLRLEPSSRRYARCLLQVAAALEGDRRPLAPMLAAPLGSGGLRRRVESILDGRSGRLAPLPPAVAALVICLVAAGVAAAGTLAPAAPPAPAPPPAPAALPGDALDLPAVAPPAPPAEAGPLPQPAPAPLPDGLPTPSAAPLPEPLPTPGPLPRGLPAPAPEPGNPQPLAPPTPAPAPPPAPEPAAAPETPEASEAPLYVILFFDDPNRVRSGRHHALADSLEQVRGFVEENPDLGARYAVLAYKNGLSSHLDWSDDPDALAAALDRVTRWRDRGSPPPAAPAGAPSLLAALPPGGPGEEIDEALARVVAAVGELPEGARVKLLLFTPGFGHLEGGGPSPGGGFAGIPVGPDPSDLRRLGGRIERAGIDLHLIDLSPRRGSFWRGHGTGIGAAAELLMAAGGTYHPAP